MVFKLTQSAENRWRKIRGFKLLGDVIDGVEFINGKKEEIETKDNKNRILANS